MRAVSKRRAVAIRLYMKNRAEFLENNPTCAVDGVRATEVHHKAGRGLLLNEVDLWLPVCRPCHLKITTEPRWAMENGYSLPRVGRSV